MASGKILIVEDDGGTRRALARFFEIMGFDVATADDVSSALDLLDLPPDMIILDLALPDGDGENILRAVRRRGYPTGVIVCTGAVETERLKEIVSLGAEVLLLKPIDLEDVFAVYTRVAEMLGLTPASQSEPRGNHEETRHRQNLVSLGGHRGTLIPARHARIWKGVD